MLNMAAAVAQTFDEGLADWRAYKAWTDALSTLPAERAGIEYWAANRSIGGAPCDTASKLYSADADSRQRFLGGCEEAKERLAIIDAKRANPDYRAGFIAGSKESTTSHVALSPTPKQPDSSTDTATASAVYHQCVAEYSLPTAIDYRNCIETANEAVANSRRTAQDRLANQAAAVRNAKEDAAARATIEQRLAADRAQAIQYCKDHPISTDQNCDETADKIVAQERPIIDPPHVSVDDFILDGRQLAMARMPRLAMQGEYAYIGGREYLFAHSGKAIEVLMTRGADFDSYSVRLLTEEADRDIRQYMLKCRNEGATGLGISTCQIHFKGYATMCHYSNRNETFPCVSVTGP